MNTRPNGWVKSLFIVAAALGVAGQLGGCNQSSSDDGHKTGSTSVKGSTMKGPSSPLGAFSVSLAVKDLAASRAFYEKLGFAVVGGKAEQNWLILRSGGTTIGLFQGMFERNLLTFNPVWDAECNTLASFQDVRELQRDLKKKGVAFATQADETTTGPASFVVVDPDGNPILFDQHVASPSK